LTASSDRGVCLVLGAGGFRGLAHLGVLRGLERLGVRIDALIGVSIGGLIGAFYAGLGVPPDALLRRFSHLRTASLFALGWSLYRARGADLAPRGPGDLREDLRALKALRLDRLCFGVQRMGLLALDLFSGEEIFTATGTPCVVPPDKVVLGGASIPGLFPWVCCEHEGRVYRLVDGGLSHSLPVERALQPPFESTRIVAVDLQVRRGFRERDPQRWARLEQQHPGRIVRIRPQVASAGTVFFRAHLGEALVLSGERAVLELSHALC
jgi:NTE family protein